MIMTTISNAINAYSALSKAVSGEGLSISSQSKSEGGTVGANDFASILEKTARDSVATMRKAETESAAGIAGKADIREVVQAVTNAELTLQTVVNVRDKVISAYNDIIHLPV
jgi:flagellar hook-basal body complex protein FliE